MGTPEFAIPALEALVEADSDIIAVVTQPDRARGRGMRVSPPPLKKRALALGLPVMQPKRVSDPEFTSWLVDQEPDVIAVVAFGQMIPKSLLDVPPLGWVNVHPSLLPLYRGASPIQQAVLEGAKETGVTTMYLDEGMDTGDIILQVSTPIGHDENAGSLHDRLARLGAELLVETLRQIESSTAERRPQEENLATVTRRLRREDGRLDWSQTCTSLANRIRAFTPWPGAFAYYKDLRVKIWRAVPRVDSPGAGSPGQIIDMTDEGLEVLCGSGTLLLQELQPDSGKRMSATAFAHGYGAREGVFT